MQNSPVDTKGVIRSEFVKDMEKQGFFEVVRFPLHLPDSVIIDMIQNDPKLWLYTMENYGVSLMTHAGCKAFFVNIRQLSTQIPSYNTKGRGGKHRRDRKNYK